MLVSCWQLRQLQHGDKQPCLHLAFVLLAYNMQ